MTAALEGGERSAARPGRTLPPRKTRYPFYRRLGGPQGRSGRAENLVPTGIRSRTVQPIAQSPYRLSYRAQKYTALNLSCYKNVILVRSIAYARSWAKLRSRIPGAIGPRFLKRHAHSSVWFLYSQIESSDHDIVYQ